LAQREEPAIENQNSDVRSEEEQLAPLFLPDVAKDFRTRWDAEFLSKKLSNQTNKRCRKKYVSLNLVYSYWTNLGGYREIGDARAH